MNHNRINPRRTIRFECFSGFGQGPTGIGHVVYEDGDFPVDIAYEGHFGDFVCAETFFVNQGKGEVETVGHSGGSVR